MQYAIEADAEFLRVRLWGRDTDEPPSHVCAEVLKESDRLGRRRILIELDHKSALSATSQYQLVTRLPHIGFTPLHSIALVHRQPQARVDNEFVNVIAENRDLPVRNFGDLENATAWLRTRAA